MSKLINIWWVLLVYGLSLSPLPAQSDLPQLYQRLEKATTAKDKASIYYKLASRNLTRKPTLSAYQGQQSYKFAGEIRNIGLQSGAAILMGKAFIAQKDYRNARLWINRGINHGKSIKSSPLVVEGTTLLSSVSVQKEDYEQAYLDLLDGLNFYNQYRGTAPSSVSNKGEIQKLQNQIAALKKREKDLQGEITNLQGEPFTEIPETIFIDTSHIAPPVIRDTTIQIVRAKQDKFLGLPSGWWITGLGLLSLGLLGGLFHLWNRQEDEGGGGSDHHLREKMRLIEDYKAELTELKSKRTFGEKILAGRQGKAAFQQKATVLILDLSAGMSDEADIVKIEKELPILTDQFHGIKMINKSGSTSTFICDPELPNATEHMVKFGEAIKEYFEEIGIEAGNPKIAVHSGSFIFAHSKDAPQGFDIWGDEMERSKWLLDQTSSGDLIITAAARDQLKQPEGWQYLGERKDKQDNSLKIYKK